MTVLDFGYGDFWKPLADTVEDEKKRSITRKSAELSCGNGVTRLPLLMMDRPELTGHGANGAVTSGLLSQGYTSFLFLSRKGGTLEVTPE